MVYPHSKILITDDNEINRMILSDMLSEEYELMEASDGVEALELLETHADEIGLMLLDVVMPRLDGYGVLEAMGKKGLLADIPVIIISAEGAPVYIRKAYDMGAVDFINRPFDQSIVHRRIVNTIVLSRKQKELTAMVAEEVAARERNNRLMVAILSNIVEFRNGESGKHVQHINTITRILLEELIRRTDRYSEIADEIGTICMSSSLHDIGKIDIPGEILNKPGRLTSEEFEVVKKHTLIGAQMMRGLEGYQDEPIVRYSYQICRWHHERWDGRGYPDGLMGDEIPIAAQVVALADVYDALTSERCYKKAFTHEKAMEMILNNECGVFNPMLLECLRSTGESLRRQLIESESSDNSKLAQSVLQGLGSRSILNAADTSANA